MTPKLEIAIADAIYFVISVAFVTWAVWLIFWIGGD
jgi:hypothetical protein